MMQFDAARTGNLQWFINQKTAGTLPDLMQRHSGNKYFPHDLAAKHGHLDVLRWLVEESGQPVNVSDDNNRAARLAAAHGHLPVVQYLVEESGQPVDVTADNNDAVRWAAENGHLQVLRWLVEESGQAVDVTTVDNEAVRYAASDGHLDVVRYLVEDSGQPVNVTTNDNYAVRVAAQNGHQSVVDYLNTVAPFTSTSIQQLRQLGLDIADTIRYLRHHPIRRSVDAGLPLTRSQMDAMLSAEQHQPTTPQRL